MKLHFLVIIAAMSAALTHSAIAQSAPGQPANGANEVDSNPRFWQATFANGGHYLVRLDSILSASKHEYISDATARVVEVTIGTSSAVVARVYYLEPVLKDTPVAAGQILLSRAEDVARQAAAKVSPNTPLLQVVKNYPASTHSHTVEFVLQTESALDSLYGSIMAALHTGRGRTWKETAGK